MKTFVIIAAATVAFAAASCVDSDLDADCPGRVQIAVRDKNYDNADLVGDVVVADNLPLSGYVASLVTRSHPQNTDLYAARQEPLAAELVFSVPAGRFARGMNDFSAVGRSLDAALQDAASFALHPDGREGEDTYLGSAAVKFPLKADQTVWMLRTKGKLMVDVVGAPATVARIGVSVGSVYAAAAVQPAATEQQPIEYSGTTSVSRLYDSQGATATYHLKLAPSAAATSPLTISLMDAAGTTLYTLTADAAIRRNHITRIRAEYAENREGEGGGLWTITVNVDGRWVKVEDMTLS